MEITHIIFASLWCLGFWKAFEPDMIFHFLDSEKYLGKLPDWLYMPIMGCTVCMGLWHGAIWFIILNGFSWWVFPFGVCVSGLNLILSSIIGRMQKK